MKPIDYKDIQKFVDEKLQQGIVCATDAKRNYKLIYLPDQSSYEIRKFDDNSLFYEFNDIIYKDPCQEAVRIYNDLCWYRD